MRRRRRPVPAPALTPAVDVETVELAARMLRERDVLAGDVAAIRRALVATGLFEEVTDPVLAVRVLAEDWRALRVDLAAAVQCAAMFAGQHERNCHELTRRNGELRRENERLERELGARQGRDMRADFSPQVLAPVPVRGGVT